MLKNIFSVTIVFVALVSSFFAYAQDASQQQYTTNSVESQEVEAVQIYFFGRDDCKYCQLEKEFLDSLDTMDSFQANVHYFDVKEDANAKAIFTNIAEANSLAKVTPLTAVGGKLIQGFDSSETTGKKILEAITLAQNGADYDLEYYYTKVDVVIGAEGCSEDPHATECEVGFSAQESFEFKLPIIGVVNLTDFSLATLSLILGFVDGFNPCAMWALVTFLLILMQIGDRKKMLYVAGLFILAQAVMYYLILNVWYQTWDFIGLDAIVTPMIGFLAIGGGVYFLYKYFKTKNQLICDVTDIEHQAGIQKKIHALVSSPVTWATTAGIIAIAFSVNIIEFACSIGIPQAFTKILELNGLSFLEHQGYIFLYMIAYIVDDLIVFGFAYYGITKLQSSYKYSKYSALIGGILMLILGAIMLLAPNMLVI